MTSFALAENCVRIDVYFIRIPYQRRELLEQFWNDVDESEIPVLVRNSLYKHGLRQGMLPSKIPVSLEKLLDLRDIPPQKPFEQVYQPGSSVWAPLHEKKTVPLLRKQQVEFPTWFPDIESTIPKLPVLAVVDGNPSGQVYTNVKGKILISADEQPDGSVIVKTIPEIHYGGVSSKITSEAGLYKRETNISKLQFDQLTVETKLLLGQWVVIGPEMRQNAGFGRDILSRGECDPEQILIGIRLMQTSKDGIHDRNEIAVLNISDDKSNQRQKDDDELKEESRFPSNIADQELGRNM